MPQLSVIIPHRRDDSLLEASLLSVLENRPADCEVIVVHDGSYSNPYQLDDEVCFVETDPGLRVVDMINAGVMAACSPVVNVVLDGVQVREHWSLEAVHLLEVEPELAAVAVGVHRNGSTTCGISPDAIDRTRYLREGRLTQTTGYPECAAPEFACGFYRRAVVLALGGFLSNVETQTAEVDWALALRALGLKSVCDSEATVDDMRSRPVLPVAYRQLARLSAEAGLVEGGWKSCLRVLPFAMLTHPARAWAWCLGVASGQRLPENLRYARAKEQLSVRRDQDRLRGLRMWTKRAA